MAAALLQEGTEEDAAPAASGSSAVQAASQLARQQQQLPAGNVWRKTVLPAMVTALQLRRDPALQECKEGAAGVLGKYAGNGGRYAAEVMESGALPPLLQLLQAGMRLAGGQRRPAIAALLSLEPLVAEPGCREQLQGPCVSASGQLDLLEPLGRLLAEATAPELDLSCYDLSPSSTSGMKLGEESGGQVVAAGWHAASVAARLCSGQPKLQDALVRRGLLPLLARFVVAEPPPPPPALAGTLLAGGPAAAGGGSTTEYMQAVRCEVAGLLRSLSLRGASHPALRGCAGLLPYLAHLLQPGAPGWTELKTAARRILQNLGELPDTDRPVLAYTPHQLAELLAKQGIEASRFLEGNITGAEFVRLPDGELRSLVAPGQLPRVLRMLRAYETFAEIDGCGARSGTISLGKMVEWLQRRGYRQQEVVLLAEALMELMDGDRDDAASFPDFLQGYEEFLARTMADVAPPSKRRRTESFVA